MLASSKRSLFPVNLKYGIGSIMVLVEVFSVNHTNTIFKVNIAMRWERVTSSCSHLSPLLSIQPMFTHPMPYLSISTYLQLYILSTETHLHPKSCNHKRIGIYYLISTLLLGLTGTILSILMRTELESSSTSRILSSENQNFYLLSITLHGLLMIFFLVMPGLIGAFGNYLGPISLGAPEVIYPRLNNMSILIIPLSYTTLIWSMNSEYGSGIGWTFYPPLSTSTMNLSLVGIDLILSGLLITGLSSTLTSLNFIVTLLLMKPYCSTLSNLSVYLWSLNIVGSLLILVLPILTGALLMLISDLHHNTMFYDPLYGGDPIFYQHLFWFFGHPEVYILILPAFGLLSNILSELIQVTLYGNQSMILAMCCISFLGAIVWSHHMFTLGLEIDTRAYFMSSTMLISLPTSTKIFNWLTTYLQLGHGSTNTIFNNTILYIQMFLLMFTLGGSTGVILGNIVVDLTLHDTYYVVTHFHFVLSLGTVIAIFSGISHFLDIILLVDDNYISNRLNRYHILVIALGILLTFTPLHFLSFNVMPRRISDFPDSLN